MYFEWHCLDSQTKCGVLSIVQEREGILFGNSVAFIRIFIKHSGFIKMVILFYSNVMPFAG
jgi:hypothetical protein